MNKAAAKKPAGRPADVKKAENVTIDLGETIEKKLLAAGLRTDLGKGGSGIRTGNSGGGPVGEQRPGLFGGYKPWYNRFNRPSMGAELTTTRTFSIIPAQLRQLTTSHVLTGLGLGIVGNRVMVRLTPKLWDNSSKILHEGLAFIVGLVPMLFKRNAYTVGVAIPGLVMLGGTIVDKVLDWVGLDVPAGRELRGSGAPRQQAALDARQRLASIAGRMQVAQALPAGQPAAQQRPVPRVTAQLQSA